MIHVSYYSVANYLTKGNENCFGIVFLVKQKIIIYKFAILYVFVAELALERLEGNRQPRNIKEAPELPRSVMVEVLSSKSKVSVTVDGTMVSYLNNSDNNMIVFNF